MRQASFKCETPQLELKSLRTFLAIKHCQGTKVKSYQAITKLVKKAGA
jgi:hypothetical protein